MMGTMTNDPGSRFQIRRQRDPRLRLRLEALRAERTEAQGHLQQLDREIANIEHLLAQDEHDALGVNFAELVDDLEEHIGVKVLRREGSRVNACATDERGDLARLALAVPLNRDGTWWAELQPLMAYADSVKRELARLGRL